MAKVLIWTLRVISGAVVFFASVGPDSVGSNTSEWLELAGVESIPPFIRSQQVDQPITLVAFALLAATLLPWNAILKKGRSFVTPPLSSPEPDGPPPPAQPAKVVSQTTNGARASAIYQEHSGAGSNIVAETVQLGPRLLQMDDDTMAAVASHLSADEIIHMVWADYGRTLALKQTLMEYLTARGFRVSETGRNGPNYRPRLTHPLMVGKRGLSLPGVTMFGGMQVIAIDGDILIE